MKQQNSSGIKPDLKFFIWIYWLPSLTDQGGEGEGGGGGGGRVE